MFGISMPPYGSRVLELAMSPGLLDPEQNRSELRVTCLLRPMLKSALQPGTDGWTCITDFRKELPFGDRSFDLVLMHGTLDLLVDDEACRASPRELNELAQRIYRVLTPGGAFTGSVANRTSRSRWPYLRRTTDPHRASATFSIGSCRKFLARAGFQDIVIFNVLPSADSPIRLLNSERRLSRIGFRRELEVIRGSITWPHYLARRVLVELSLNRYFEESIFFWAYRP